MEKELCVVMGYSDDYGNGSHCEIESPILDEFV
jgi:hypothetical protein